MLNRRILRTKAFKTLYSYAENPGMSLKELEANLEISCESTRDLYLFLLAIICPLSDFAAQKASAAMAKFNPSEEEANPNLKFVNNAIATLLKEDPDFQKIIAKKKFSWDQYDALISALYSSIKEKEYFQKYMSSTTSSIKEDALLFKSIFENEFEDNQALIDILEELSIYWNDDLGLALYQCVITMKAFAAGERWNLPYLYQSDRLASEIKTGKRQNDKRPLESDHEFVIKLVRTAYANYTKYCQAVAELTPKWTLDRLCATDLVIIACGLAEAKTFPTTPLNIIINEYIELTKCYSTPDSRGFVNGLLDKLLKQEQI